LSFLFRVYGKTKKKGPDLSSGPKNKIIYIGY